MDWAGLSVDLLIEFAVRLTVIDWLKFRRVCTAWRQAADTALGSGRRPKPEAPWLMLASGHTDPTTASFLSFSAGRCRAAPLPEPAIQRRLWIGSAHGWAVTADEECSLHLLNPVTGAQLPLPCITTMGFFQALPRTESNKATGFLFDESSFLAAHWPEKTSKDRQPQEIPIDRMPLRFLRKAMPLRDPSSGEYLVVMIHGPMYKLVFARQGDARWVVLPSPYLFEDVILYKEQCYAMTACGALLVWEPDGEKFKSRMIAVPEHNEGEKYVCFKKYLAESLDGDLVLIWREYRSCHGGGEEYDSSTSDDDDDDDDNAEHDPTVRFQIFVLHEGRQGSEWKEVHNLGGAALFIGYNSAVFFSSDGIPNLLADCVYFTDDRLDISWRRKQEPRDMGVFDMKNRVVTLMSSVDQNSNNWPPPIWVTPSIDIVKAA